MIQDTFFMVKPDAVKNRYLGDIIMEIDKREFNIVRLRMVKLTPLLAKILYNEHEGKVFFQRLITYICSGPVVAIQLQGENSIIGVRKMVDYLRVALGESDHINAAHASDSEESAEYELGLFNLIERL